MAYADKSDVKQRAGRLAEAWTATSEVSEDDLDSFAASASAEVDAVLAGLGYAVPVTGSAALALKNGVAYCALAMALPATIQGGQGAENIGELLSTARDACMALHAGLLDGTAAVITVLSGGATAPGAGSLDDDLDAQSEAQEVEVLQAQGLPPYLEPAPRLTGRTPLVRRGEPL